MGKIHYQDSTDANESGVPVSQANPLPVTGTFSNGTTLITPLGTRQGAVTNASQLLSAIVSIPATSTGVRIDVEGGAVRWTCVTADTPTSTFGARQLQDGGFEYTGDLTQLKFILDSTASAAKLNCIFFK